MIHEAEEEQSDDDSNILEDIQTVRANLASRFLAVSSDTESADSVGGANVVTTQAQRKRLSESRMEALRKKGRKIAHMEGQLPVLLHASEVEVPATPAALHASSSTRLARAFSR